MLFHPGKTHVGELIVADLGFRDEVLQVHSLGIYLLDRTEAARRLSPRRSDAHKYRCGTAVLVSGSRRYTGAALLAAEAVLRSGCGMVYVAVPEGVRDLIESRLREAITIPVPETQDGTIAPEAWPVIEPYVNKADVLVVGPGLDRHPETTRFVHDVLARNTKPLVLDADGINALEGETGRLAALTVPTVITPHTGELSRLVAAELPNTPYDKIEATRTFAKTLGVTLVHKGAPTLIASAAGDVWVNYHGNSALASAGTGDVLTGLVGGLVAQGEDVLAAACIACFLHGRSGEVASEVHGIRGVIAGDLLEFLGEPIFELEAAAPGR
jgi:NAD(P)H-hydrate epimerase